jgi:hypothetical protein
LECTIIPHRKSPSGVAINFIRQTAKFDRLKKERINTVTDGEVLAELGRAFPENAPTSAVFPKGFIGIRGLVLEDTRGEGALELDVKPEQETIEDFMISQREGALQ